MEVIDMKIRRKVDPEKWPLPGLSMPNQTHTDFSQLINCPEFVPRQMPEEARGDPLLISMLTTFIGECPAFITWKVGPFPPCNHVNDSPAGSPRVSTPVKQKTKTESDVSNLKTMPKGLSASLPDLDSESWIEVKKRPRPSPARAKVS